MSEPSPWDGLSVPKSDYIVLQASAKTAVPCFWGRDNQGACLLIIELSGDHTAQLRKNAPAINGIDVDLRSGAEGSQRLVLALQRETDRDLFAGLCVTLVSALENATDSSSSLAIALAHLRRWKAFLAGQGAQLLTAEQVRGLFAELKFLSELIQKCGCAEAVAAWLGPERSHQDFIYGNTAVEVKSLSGAERSSVRISSEDQLESLNEELFLRVYRLSNMAESASAQSLNDLVKDLQSQLTDADAIEEFDRKLAVHGYAPLPPYDEPRFVVSEIRSYRVENEFPKLVRSALPGGIAKVGYDIKLEAIAQYECDGECAFGGI